jgi:hypothetical protein
MQECWDEHDHTSDSELTTGPRIFWKNFAWSAEDECADYAQISDWELEDSDTNTIEIEPALPQDKDIEKDEVEVVLENGLDEDEEEQMRSVGWEPLEG